MTGFFIAVIGLGGAGMIVLARPQWQPSLPTYGVTFSIPQARGLGLEWHEVYQAILNDLQVRQLRLVAYWDSIEPGDDEFDFTDLDYQMDEAARHQATVILAIGRKVPRWPECFEPSWVRGQTEAEKQVQILEMMRVVVTRYRDHPALRMWQLENEPLLDFGECAPADEAFLARQEAWLRSLDGHLILVTDSGELHWWLAAARYGDVLGTTMYRTVFSSRTQKLFHYDYIFPAWLYRAKARLVRLVRGHPVLISELQGEPWSRAPFQYVSRDERQQSFSPQRFRELQQLARRSQLPEAYWWGVEYWYWEKVVHQESEFWDIAREMFTGGDTY